MAIKRFYFMFHTSYPQLLIKLRRKVLLLTFKKRTGIYEHFVVIYFFLFRYVTFSLSSSVYFEFTIMSVQFFFFFCGCGQFRKNIWNRYIKSAFLTRRNQANSWCISWFLVFFLYHSSYRTLVINVIVLLLLFYM